MNELITTALNNTHTVEERIIYSKNGKIEHTLIIGGEIYGIVSIRIITPLQKINHWNDILEEYKKCSHNIPKYN